jgi:thymidylate synthase ThyX
MTQTSATIIAHSVADGCPPLTTYKLRFPRIILAEFNTHRAFSRNAKSSRAVPIKRMLREVRENPYSPPEWRYKNEAGGMQPGELMSFADTQKSEYLWNIARHRALECAEELDELGATKEHVNRLLEPFSWTDVVMTTTRIKNFNALRLDNSAQIDIRILAQKMLEAAEDSVPTELKVGQWHKPFCTLGEPVEASVARCARVSYVDHYGRNPSLEADLALYESLLSMYHLSPFEHQAKVGGMGDFKGNFSGNWRQNRKLVEADYDLECEE